MFSLIVVLGQAAKVVYLFLFQRVSSFSTSCVTKDSFLGCLFVSFLVMLFLVALYFFYFLSFVLIIISVVVLTFSHRRGLVFTSLRICVGLYLRGSLFKLPLTIQSLFV